MRSRKTYLNEIVTSTQRSVGSVRNLQKKGCFPTPIGFKVPPERKRYERPLPYAVKSTGSEAFRHAVTSYCASCYGDPRSWRFLRDFGSGMLWALDGQRFGRSLKNIALLAHSLVLSGVNTVEDVVLEGQEYVIHSSRMIQERVERDDGKHQS